MSDHPAEERRAAAEPTSPGRCDVYWPGHVLHHIPLFKAINERDDPGVEGEIVEIDGPRIVVVIGGVRREFWNHATARVAAAVHTLGPTVTVHERWRVLRFPLREEGSPAISIATSAEQYRPCPTAPLESDDPIEALIARGGGYLSLDDLDEA